MNLTEKFEKELYKFKEWIIDNYTPFSITNNQQTCFENIDMSNYIEPPRNKLEVYVKMIMKDYKIISKETGNQIENYKTIVINFKNAKITKKNEKKESKKTKIIKNAINVTIIPTIDKTIDSSDFYWHDTLEDINTEQLINIFGEPDYVYSENRDSKDIWEWKITIGNNKYCIYDWRSDFLHDTEKHTRENMNNIIWNLGGESKKRILNDIKILIKYINTNQNINVDNTEQDWGSRPPRDRCLAAEGIPSEQQIYLEENTEHVIEECTEETDACYLDINSFDTHEDEDILTDNYLIENSDEIDIELDFADNNNKLANLSLVNIDFSLDEIEFDDN